MIVLDTLILIIVPHSVKCGSVYWNGVILSLTNGVLTKKNYIDIQQTATTYKYHIPVTSIMVINALCLMWKEILNQPVQ